MHIVILALGSRGDVQPFVALALALQAQGRQVTIAAAADYAPLVTDYGVGFVGVAGYVRELMDFALVNELLDGAGNPLRFARTFLRELDPLLTQIVADCWQIAQRADALIVSTLGLLVGLHLVEKRPCPLVAVHLHPLFATPQRAHVNFPTAPAWLPGRRAYHRLTHHMGWHGLWQLLRRPLNRVRRTVLDLPPLSVLQLYSRAGATVPTLYAYSPLVAPPVKAELPAAALLTGYWWLPPAPAWQPPAALCAFLAAGPAPVLITFGSILGGRDPNRMTELLVDALHRSGQRGLIYRGWGDLGNLPLPATVMAIEAVPHGWLLPQVVAVVHHGGAGVTAAALRAGVPSVVVPVFGDQIFWAERVHALGVTPHPIPRHHLTSHNLAAAMQQAITDPTQRARRQPLAASLQAEAGVAVAIRWLEAQSGFSTQ